MSWGPRASQSYRCRKMAGRAAMRAYRNKQGVSKNRSASRTPRPPTSSSSRPAVSPKGFALPKTASTPKARPVIAETDTARDHRYFIGARRAFFVTLGFLLLALLLVPPAPTVAVFLLSVCCLAAFILCFVYRVQLRHSEDQDFEVSASSLLAGQQWETWLAQHPPSQADAPAKALITPVPNTQAGPAALAYSAAPRLHELNVRKSPAQESFQYRQAEDEACLDYEMRWRRDARRGKPTGEGEDRQMMIDVRAKEHEVAEVRRRKEYDACVETFFQANDTEQQIQELERQVRQGPAQ